jgi:hypothetical protein
MPELPTAYPLRDLFDAAARGRNIRLTCAGCGHSATLSGMAIWWLFQRRGWLDDFQSVRRRSVCTACWRLHRRKVHNPKLALVESPTTDTHLPLPSAIEWKKEVRRRR